MLKLETNVLPVMRIESIPRFLYAILQNKHILELLQHIKNT